MQEIIQYVTTFEQYQKIIITDNQELYDACQKFPELWDIICIMDKDAEKTTQALLENQKIDILRPPDEDIEFGRFIEINAISYEHGKEIIDDILSFAQIYVEKKAKDLNYPVTDSIKDLVKNALEFHLVTVVYSVFVATDIRKKLVSYCSDKGIDFQNETKIIYKRIPTVDKNTLATKIDWVFKYIKEIESPNG